MRRRAALLAAVALIGGGSVVGSTCACLSPGPQPSSPPEESGAATANIWVGASGSCADELAEVEYSAATSCGTLDAANDTCDNGDLIRIKDGTTLGSSATAATSVTGANSRTVPCVVKDESDGVININGALTLTTGASDLTVYSPYALQQNNTAYDEYQFLKIETTGDDITIYNPDFSTVNLFACADDCTLEGGVNGGIGDIGPCLYDNPGPVCTPKISGVPANSSGWTMKNLAVHGSLSVLPEVEDCGSDSCHTVGLAIFGGKDILLDGISFYDNQTTNIRVQDCCTNGVGPGLTIQNSRFGPPYNFYDSLAGEYGYFNSNAIDFDTQVAGVVVQFSSFYMRPGACPAAGETCGIYATPNGTVGSNTVVRANIISPPTGCGTNASFNNYNVFREWNEFNGCTGVGATNSYLDYTASIPYTSMCAWNGSTSTSPCGEPDFHIPAATSWAGQDKVTVGCIPFDADGVARGSTCDPGAYEH